MDLTQEEVNKAVNAIFWNWYEGKIGTAQLMIRLQRIKQRWDDRDNK